MWIDFQSIGGPPKITEIRLPGIINSALIFNVWFPHPVKRLSLWS